MLCFGSKKKGKKLQVSDPASIIVQKSEQKRLDENIKQQRIFKILDEAREQNVFRDSNIVPSIFSNLSINELLRMRLVCKMWNKHACEALRERTEGIVILQRGLGYYMNVMSSSIDIPIGKIFLNIIHMDDPQPKQFFKQFGHSVYHLILNLEGHSVPQFQLNMHCLKNMQQLSLNLFNEFGNPRRKSSQMMNLRSTDVQILIEDYDEEKNSPEQLLLPKLDNLIMSCEASWRTNEPYLVEQILKISPNLKNLNLAKWPFPLKYDLFEKSPLENLQFITLAYIGAETLSSLSSKKLQLKSADFCCDYDVGGDSIDKFLESVAGTLQYLRIESKSNENMVFRLQVSMPQLVTIRLTHWVGPIWLDTIAKHGPKLMKLQFSNCHPSHITVKHPRANSSVKKLAVNFGSLTVSPKARSEVVKSFIHIFPALEGFMMRQVSDKTLGLIVNGWPKLKALRVTTTFGMTDSGLTGIPIAELSKMTKLENKLSCGCCLPVHVEDGKPCLEPFRKYPHIGMLHDLVDLSVESEDGSHFPLTNFSLHLGVHELTKLHSLKITCHNELGPHWCLRCIADNLPNLKELTVMDRAISHDRYEEHEVHYLLKRLPNLKLNLIPTSVGTGPTNAF